MKKTAMLLIVLALIVLAPSFTAFACDCDCPNCKDCNKETSIVQGAPEKLMNARTKALKAVKSVAKKYGWDITTETVKSTAKKLWTKVSFNNTATHKLMELQLRVEGSKAAWYFQEAGKWVKTTASGIKKVLKNSGKKVTAAAKAKTLSDVTMELFQPVAEYGSKLNWMSELSVEDEDTDYQFSKIHFWNLDNGYTLDVEIHAEKNASGTTADWYFLSKEGTYKRSSSDLIKEVLHDYSGKDL